MPQVSSSPQGFHRLSTDGGRTARSFFAQRSNCLLSPRKIVSKKVGLTDEICWALKSGNQEKAVDFMLRLTLDQLSKDLTKIPARPLKDVVLLNLREMAATQNLSPKAKKDLLSFVEKYVTLRRLENTSKYRELRTNTSGFHQFVVKEELQGRSKLVSEYARFVLAQEADLQKRFELAQVITQQQLQFQEEELQGRLKLVSEYARFVLAQEADLQKRFELEQVITQQLLQFQVVQEEELQGRSKLVSEYARFVLAQEADLQKRFELAQVITQQLLRRSSSKVGISSLLRSSSSSAIQTPLQTPRALQSSTGSFVRLASQASSLQDPD
jgi:metal-responsive CopG/Arc/MetJ family transcriptional regulator